MDIDQITRIKVTDQSDEARRFLFFLFFRGINWTLLMLWTIYKQNKGRFFIISTEKKCSLSFFF